MLVVDAELLKRTRFGRARAIAALLLAGVLAACVVAFPGRRLGMAMRIGTGVNLAPLQSRIDELEERAIARRPFSDDDRAFLSDFYRTLATGAKLSVVIGQTGRLMDRYLDATGADYRLDPIIFRDNERVRAEIAALSARARRGGCAPGTALSSPTFYMPHRSNLDSVFGLYYGTLTVTPAGSRGERCALHVRAEVPWTWPSYASLKRKYGRAHAESFPLPNAMSLLLGRRHALFVDNGLGEYLVHLGLAKPFIAHADWDE